MDLASIKQVVTYGTYYNPAWKHYGRITTVRCDRCHSNPIQSCIGFDKMDLCMKCMSEVEKSISPSSSIPSCFPSPSPYTPSGSGDLMTLMSQSQFGSFMQQSQFETKMEQSQFGTTRMEQSTFQIE